MSKQILNFILLREELKILNNNIRFDYFDNICNYAIYLNDTEQLLDDKNLSIIL